MPRVSARRILAALAAALSILAAAVFWPRPVIRSIDPVAAAPGDTVRISGERFGEPRPDSWVLLDGSRLTLRSVLSWTPGRIEIVMPSTADSGFIRVRTGFGISNIEGIIATAKVPRTPARGEASRSGPSISGAFPEAAEIGDLVTLQGFNLGLPGADARVTFSRAQGGTAPGAERFPELEGYIDHWDDSSVTVRVPDGAGSGAVTLRTAQGRVAQTYLDITASRGSKRMGTPAAWVIDHRIAVRSVRSGGANELYLWIPEIPATSSQIPLRELEASAAPHLRPGSGAVAAYRYADIPDRSEIVFSRTTLVLVRQVETAVMPQAGFPAPPQGMEFLAPALAEDPEVPSGRKEVRDLASRIVGLERDQRRKALRIWDWAVRRLVWQPARVSDPVAALKSGKADSKAFAMACAALLRASGVPALPVSGSLVKNDGTLVPHFWVEYYLMGIGWIPFDAALGSGALPGGFDAALSPPSRYHGSLDDRHVAVASGYARIEPLLAGAARQGVKALWGLQSLYEESTGVNSRDSAWEAPGIRRAY